MRQALDACAGIFTNGERDAHSLRWQDLRYQHTQAIRAALADKYAPASANKILAALRGVLRECWRLCLMSAEDYHRAADLQAVQGERLPAGRALSAGELRAVFAACAADASAAGARDSALLAVLYGGGLRRSEATSLDLGDYQPETGELRARTGKGEKQRLVYLNGGGKEALAAWLAHRGPVPGPLFFPVDRRGHIEPRRMSAQVCRWMLRKRAKAAGIAHLPSPHDLRRTFIGDLLDAGADISIVQRLAGHAKVGTTQRYDRRPEAAKRAAAALLHIPFLKARP
jgi:site-specific recombinase XerD